MSQIKSLLENTKYLQTLFMLERLKTFRAKLSGNPLVFFSNYKIVTRFQTLTGSKEGVYALMDYLNFKGDGLEAKERYNGYGWGLKQALEEMDEDGFKNAPLAEFSRSTYKLLERRVENSNPERNESLWLPGWKKRTVSYTEFNC
jgi:hypothetical protein